MKKILPASLPSPLPWAFEIMAVIYVAVTALLVVNPNWPILIVNKAFSGRGWPVVFFPTEKFWLSLAVTVPGTRAFLAFAASRRPSNAPFCVAVLQVSFVIPAIMFAAHFLFYKHAPLYAIAFFLELVQVLCCWYVKGKLRKASTAHP